MRKVTRESDLHGVGRIIRAEDKTEIGLLSGYIMDKRYIVRAARYFLISLRWIKRYIVTGKQNESNDLWKQCVPSLCICLCSALGILAIAIWRQYQEKETCGKEHCRAIPSGSDLTELCEPG
jgi:hypothetical protein